MKHNVFLAALLFGTTATLSASLIPVGLVPLSGQGLGAVNTVLTFKTANGQTDFESGCVGGNTNAPPGSNTGPGFCQGTSVGGDEQAQNNVYLASTILTGGQDFGNLQLIFNASEPQNATSPEITVEDLTLTLWDATTGGFVAAFMIEQPYTPTTLAGVGNAGYGFILDDAQASQANALGPLSGLYIGVSATATGASGGLDTVSVRSAIRDDGPDPGVIPEPSTYVLLGSALLGLAVYGRRRRA